MTRKEIELLRGRIYRELTFIHKSRSRKATNALLQKQQEFTSTSTEESDSMRSDSQAMKTYTEDTMPADELCTHNRTSDDAKSAKRAVNHSRLCLKNMVLKFSSKFKTRRLKTSIDEMKNFSNRDGAGPNKTQDANARVGSMRFFSPRGGREDSRLAKVKKIKKTNIIWVTQNRAKSRMCDIL